MREKPTYNCASDIMSDRGRTPNRLTKWAGKSSRFVEIGGEKLDTIITGHLTQEQINAYQQIFRIEEISDLLRKAGNSKGSLLKHLPSSEVQNFKRDPSPPPQYDSSGNRTNTRDIRIQDEIDKERHALVEVAITSIRNYEPPADYNKPAKTSEKLYIPVKDYPDINFVGLLLGPRGNTLRQLQDDSGAKLAIRGKGSVKYGKSTDTSNPSGVEDDLHVVITAETTAKINAAIKLTNQVIEKAISSPFGQNDMKRDQLRELAVLNGTLRETKPYVPPEIFNAQRRAPAIDVTQIVCRKCGKVGHYTRDCKAVVEMGQNSQPEPFVPEQAYQSKRESNNEHQTSKRSRLEPNVPAWMSQIPEPTGPPMEDHYRFQSSGGPYFAPTRHPQMPQSTAPEPFRNGPPPPPPATAFLSNQVPPSSLPPPPGFAFPDVQAPGPRLQPPPPPPTSHISPPPVFNATKTSSSFFKDGILLSNEPKAAPPPPPAASSVAAPPAPAPPTPPAPPAPPAPPSA